MNKNMLKLIGGGLLLVTTIIIGAVNKKEEEETKFQVNFDFIIQANKIKYKTNITLSLPCEKLLTEGTSNKEITDMSGIVFKRIK